MGLNIFTTNFSNLSKEKTFRKDTRFIDFQNNFIVKDYYSFDDLFILKKDNKVDIYSLKDDFFYSEIGNVSKEGETEPVQLNFEDRNIKDENYYKKIAKGDIICVENYEILISKVRPNLKKIVFISENNNNIFYTSAFIHLLPKKINKILYYALITIFHDNLTAISRQGKGYPVIKESDLQYLKFDKNIIDYFIKNKDKIISQIENIENKINNLKSKIKSPKEIINKVFAREFNFDLEKFNKLKKKKLHTIDLTNFSNNKDLRNSAKFHRKSGKFVLSELKMITNKKN